MKAGDSAALWVVAKDSWKVVGRAVCWAVWMVWQKVDWLEKPWVVYSAA